MNWQDLSLSEKSELMKLYLQNGITSLDAMKEHYNSFDTGGSMSPDHDPNNPYHYHNAKGEKIVITPEDWEANVGKPYFKEVEDAVRAEQSAYPGPEYEVNPDFVRDLRNTYSYNMGSGYQNYRNFSSSLPQGYTFTSEGMVVDPQGNYYVQSGYKQTPRFTYSTDNPLQFTIYKGKPIERNLTFYPVNMDKKVKEPLPVDRTLDVKAEYQAAVDNYIQNNINNRYGIGWYDHTSDSFKDKATYGTLGIFSLKNPDEYGWESGTEHYYPMSEGQRNKLNDAFNRVVDRQDKLGTYSKEDMLSILKAGGLEQLIDDFIATSTKPSRKEAEKKAVISIDPLEKVNTFASGGHLYQTGGPDDPDEDKIYASSTVYKAMPDINITDERPAWQRGLTNYDWARARQYYSNPDGTLTPRGFEFLKNVASKNRTGTSNYMRDVNKLSYIPNAAVGAIGAIPAVAGLIAATTNPVVDAVLTTHGLITAPKNIKEGIQDIQEGNTWQGIGELGLTALDLTGAGQLLGRTGRMFNKGYRAKHAYNTIMPASYDNPIQRGKEWVRDMWYNEPVDMKTPKWFKQTKTQRDLADSSKMPYEQANMTGYTNTAEYITPGTENAAKIADEARLDAWAIYNGLEPQYGTYIKNADGTYSYDLARIRRISNDTWNPAYTPDNIPFNIKLSAGNGQDFVTGAGGGLTDFRILGTDTHGNGIMRIEDVWDLHPFSRSSDVLSKRIQKKLFPNWEEKFANPMFEKASRVLDWGLSHNSKRIENLGNKMFDASDKPLFGLLEKIDDKMKNFEVGKLTGGKPFKMSTNIKYHLEDPLLSRLEMDELGNINFNSGKQVLYYGFTPDYIANIKPIEKDLYNAYDLGVLKDMLKNITKEK